MSYRILIKPNAKKAIDTLPKSLKKRIKTKIEALSSNPRPPDCKKLEGFGEVAWRVRVGKWRMIYSIDDKERTVVITAVAHRSSAYRRK